MARNGAGTGIALQKEQYGFQRKTASRSTFWKFVISGMEFTRGSLHPASGSDGEGCPLPPSFPRVHARRLRGHSTPPGIPPPPPGTTSPVTSPQDPPSIEKRTWPSRPSPLEFAWWPLPELNWGHEDFQSSALPSELKGHLVQRLANILAFERRCIRSSFVALVRRTLPVRLHSRALLARRIDALDASGYLRDATLKKREL